MSERPPEFRENPQSNDAPSHIPPTLPEPGGGTPGRKVLLGLLIGGALSLIVWPLVFLTDNGSLFLIALGALLAIKGTGGILLIIRGRRTRLIGIGLLISIGLGGLIFFGTCGVAILTAMQHGG